MAYDNARAYANIALVAQNVVATASGAVAVTTTTGYVPVAEPSFLVSLAVAPSATSANLVSNATINALVYTVSGTTTTTATSSALQVSAANLAVLGGAFQTQIPPLAVASGQSIALVTKGTGTASATETISALNVSVGLSPQFV